MKLYRVEIGKRSYNPEIHERTDFEVLYNSFDSLPLSNKDSFEKEWLVKDDLGGESPFITGEDDNYRGLGNIAFGQVKNSEDVVFFQVLRRREHELYGISFAESKQDSSLFEGEKKERVAIAGSRMYDQCAYTLLKPTDVRLLLEDECSIALSLAYQDEDDGFKLPDYHENIHDVGKQIQKKDLLSSELTLLKSVVNWLLSNCGQQEKACLLTKSLDLRQKLNLIDQLQYLLYPLIGVLTYQTEYVSKASTKLYLFDYDRYHDLCDKGEFPGYKMIDESNILDYRAPCDIDYYSILSSLPHRILYSTEFKYLVDHDVSIEIAAELSLLILDEQYDGSRISEYLSRNHDAISDEILSFFIETTSDIKHLRPLEKGLGSRILEQLRNRSDDRFLPFFWKQVDDSDISEQSISILLAWILENRKKFGNSLLTKKDRELFFAFYCRILHDEGQEVKNLRARLISGFCSSVPKEFINYFLQENIALRNFSEKEKNIFIKCIIAELDYKDLDSLLAILRNRKLDNFLIRFGALLKIIELNYGDYANQGEKLLELLSLCEASCISENGKSVMLYFAELPNAFEKLAYFSTLFCNSPELIDKWHFSYLIALPSELYRRCYEKLLDHCLENDGGSSPVSNTVNPINNHGKLRDADKKHSYASFGDNSENVDKLLAVFRIWLEKDVFSKQLFDLLMRFPEILSEDGFFSNFQYSWLVESKYYIVHTLDKENVFIYRNEVKSSLNFNEISFFLTDDNVIKSFKTWQAYKQFVGNFELCDCDQFDFFEFVSLVNSMPDNQQNLKKGKYLSLPQIIFGLCIAKLDKECLRKIVTTAVKVYKIQNVSDRVFQKLKLKLAGEKTEFGVS